MLIRTETLTPSKDWNEDWVLFDIETTGLSHTHQVVMISFIIFDEEWRLITYMAEGISEERLLLMQFSGILKEKHLLVHFNGASFDLPFLKSRLKHHGIYSLLECLHHVDLLKYFPKAKLKHIEASMGFKRKDLLDGKTWALYYRHYWDHLEELLGHNREDVLSMMYLIEKDQGLFYFLKLQKVGSHFLEKMTKSKRSLRLYYGVNIDLDLLWVDHLAFIEDEFQEDNQRRLLISHGFHYENIYYFVEKRLRSTQ